MNPSPSSRQRRPQQQIPQRVIPTDLEHSNQPSATTTDLKRNIRITTQTNNIHTSHQPQPTMKRALETSNRSPSPPRHQRYFSPSPPHITSPLRAFPQSPSPPLINHMQNDNNIIHLQTEASRNSQGHVINQINTTSLISPAQFIQQHTHVPKGNEEIPDLIEEDNKATANEQQSDTNDYHNDEEVESLAVQRGPVIFHDNMRESWPYIDNNQRAQDSTSKGEGRRRVQIDNKQCQSCKEQQRVSERYYLTHALDQNCIKCAHDQIWTVRAELARQRLDERFGELRTPLVIHWIFQLSDQTNTLFDYLQSPSTNHYLQQILKVSANQTCYIDARRVLLDSPFISNSISNQIKDLTTTCNICLVIGYAREMHHWTPIHPHQNHQLHGVPQKKITTCLNCLKELVACARDLRCSTYLLDGVEPEHVDHQPQALQHLRDEQVTMARTASRFTRSHDILGYFF